MRTTEKDTARKDKKIMLVINEQIKTEILKNGLKLAETLADLHEVCKNYAEEVNQVDIYRDEKNDKIRVYLTHHDEKSGNYNYLADGERIKLALHDEPNAKRMIYNLILNCVSKKDFKKTERPLTGYTVKELANNRPLTLLNAKNKNFVCFICVNFHFFNDGTSRVNEIDIDEDKTEKTTNYFLSLTNNYWNANEVRKTASNVFAIYNSQMTEYRKKESIKAAKRAERRTNKKYVLMHTRYNYNERDFGCVSSFDPSLTCWGCAYAFKDTADNEKLSSDYISYKGEKIQHNYKTRKELFYGLLVDKNGFFKLDKIYSLKKRAEQLKAQRQKEKEIILHEEWINSDHIEQERTTKEKQNVVYNLIKDFATPETILNDYGVRRLEMLKDIYKEITSLLKFDQFANLEKWQARQKEVYNEYDFKLSIILQNLFGCVGCFHQYEETATGYKMTEKYINDSYWTKYLHEFAKVTL